MRKIKEIIGFGKPDAEGTWGIPACDVFRANAGGAIILDNGDSKMEKNQKRVVILALAVMAALAIFGVVQAQFLSTGSETLDSSEKPVVSAAPGKVTMIDLGANECIPCKMMAPIIEELKKEYAGRADIIFIDVWKEPAQGKKYGIRAIPTQIFFDAEGREVHRNTGFMDKKRIVEVLTRLGVR